MGKDNIAKILESIEKLKSDLAIEYSKLQLKYSFIFKKNKVIFSDAIKKYHISRRYNFFKYVFTAEIRNVMSAPFIYSIIFPALFLDLMLTIYQFTALPLYGVPRVKRKDYFIYDRRFLKYLNLLQKINCLYCSYVNGLFAYAVEIGGRTEQYWCPIKHAANRAGEHTYFKEFADFGDPEKFNEIFNKNICFKK